MGCGSSSAKVGVEPGKMAPKPDSQAQISTEENSVKAAGEVRTSSGKSRDSGFGDHKHESGRSTATPPPRTVGFKAPVPLTGKVQADEDEAEVLRKLRTEGLIQRSMTKTNFGVSFEVVEDDKVLRSRPPPRLARLERESTQRKTLTDDQINAKLEKAKKRKRIQEAKRLSRIRSTTRQDTRPYPENDQDNSLPNMDLYSNARKDLNKLDTESNAKHRGYENQSPSQTYDDFYLKSEARPLPALPTTRVETTPRSRLSSSPSNSNRNQKEYIRLGGAGDYSTYDRSSMGSNRDVKPTEMTLKPNYDKSSNLDRYDDSKNGANTFEDYSREAALDVSAMLSAAQERIDNFKKSDRARASPLNLSRENSPSPPSNLGASKWLKKDTDKRKVYDEKKRDYDYNDDYRRNNRERPLSRLSVASSGSDDSADFWNE